MKPNRIATNLENFPLALAPLCQLNHWVLWRWELRKDAWTKPPYMAANPRRKAKNNDPATWAPYPTAVETLKRTNGAMDGIGFALPDTPFDVVDLDHCLDPKTGTVDEWAATWVNAANGAYVERTPSGAGLRIIGLGSGEKLHRKWSVKSARKDAAIEIYRGCERYITVTGAQLGECKELASLNILDKIKAHYDTKQTDAGFDFNKAGASTKRPKIDYDAVIKDGPPADCSDVSALFHSVVGHLAAKAMSVDAIVDELSRWPKGIARRYAGRLRGEVERSFEKWQRKRKIHVDDSAVEPEEPVEWEQRDKKGIPKPTLANARRAILALGVECRLDEFHNKPLIKGRIVPQLNSIDFIVADLRRKVHTAFKFDPGKNHMLDAVEQLYMERCSSSDLLGIVIGIHPSKQRDIEFKRLGRRMRKLGWHGPAVIRVGNELIRGYERKKSS